ncbi:MAG: DUF485 domain-containing protein [Myxococcales bacterium]|nr:DUF485 domain-containing protein [Myxococcales bacterium]
MSEDDHEALARLSRKRWTVAITLTGAMLLVYFGFVLLIAYDKPLLGRILTPGLSLGILLGAIVILFASGLTGIYVRWANGSYDTELDALKARADAATDKEHADADGTADGPASTGAAAREEGS